MNDLTPGKVMGDVVQKATGAMLTPSSTPQAPVAVDQTRNNSEIGDVGAGLKGQLREGAGGIRSRIEGSVETIGEMIRELSKTNPGLYKELQTLLQSYAKEVHKIEADLKRDRESGDIDTRNLYNRTFNNKVFDAEASKYGAELSLAQSAQGGVAFAHNIAGMVGTFMSMYGAYKGDDNLIEKGTQLQQMAMNFRANLPTQKITPASVVPDQKLSSKHDIEYSGGAETRRFEGTADRLTEKLPQQTHALAADVVTRLRQDIEDMSTIASGGTPPQRADRPRLKDLSASSKDNPISSALGMSPEQVRERHVSVSNAIESATAQYAGQINAPKDVLKQALGAIAFRESNFGLKMHVTQSALQSSAGGAWHFLDGHTEAVSAKYAGDPEIRKRLAHHGVKNPADMTAVEADRVKRDDNLAARLVLLEMGEVIKRNPSAAKDAVTLATEAFMSHNMGEGGKQALMSGGMNGLRALTDRKGNKVGEQIILNNPIYFRGAESASDVVQKYRTDMTQQVANYNNLQAELRQETAPVKTAKLNPDLAAQAAAGAPETATPKSGAVSRPRLDADKAAGAAVKATLQPPQQPARATAEAKKPEGEKPASTKVSALGHDSGASFAQLSNQDTPLTPRFMASAAANEEAYKGTSTRGQKLDAGQAVVALSQDGQEVKKDKVHVAVNQHPLQHFSLNMG